MLSHVVTNSYLKIRIIYLAILKLISHLNIRIQAQQNKTMIINHYMTKFINININKIVSYIS